MTAPPVLLNAVILLLFSGASLASGATQTEAARASFAHCQQQHLAAISTAHENDRDAALALTNRCADEYGMLVKSIARSEFDSSNERRMFSIDQNSTMLKIEASLPAIEDYR